MAQEPNKEPPKPEGVTPDEVKTESDPFLDEMYEDYKERMGKNYNKSLEKLDKKQAILTMKLALSMIPKKEEEKEKEKPIDKTKKTENPTNPPPVGNNPPSNVYQPDRATLTDSLKTAGGYFGMSQKIANRIKNLQTR